MQGAMRATQERLHEIIVVVQGFLAIYIVIEASCATSPASIEGLLLALPCTRQPKLKLRLAIDAAFKWHGHSLEMTVESWASKAGQRAEQQTTSAEQSRQQAQ